MSVSKLSDYATPGDVRRAMRIAAAWHGGQWTRLYALASTGTVAEFDTFSAYPLEDLVDEITEAGKDATISKADRRDLAWLLHTLQPWLQADRDGKITRRLGIAYLMRDGNARVPCSRYGSDTKDCAPVAWRLAFLVCRENGEPMSLDTLEWAMSLVVNDHDDVAYMIRDYGHRQYR